MAGLAGENAASLKDKPISERVAAVAAILQQESGFAEWSKSEEGYEIVDHNCVYRRIAQSHGEVCEWHLALLSQLLGSDVRCTQFMSRGADSCRFIVDGRQ